jgi:hypothetical protein
LIFTRRANLGQPPHIVVHFGIQELALGNWTMQALAPI